MNNMSQLSQVPKGEILSKISQFDTEPEWCLPPKFWNRAVFMDDLKVYHLGIRIGFPFRECHISSITVCEAKVDDVNDHRALATGYAFSGDAGCNVWFRHTWVINAKLGILLENTPSKFDSYFGVALTPKEFQEFKEIIGYEPPEKNTGGKQ